MQDPLDKIFKAGVRTPSKVKVKKELTFEDYDDDDSSFKLAFASPLKHAGTPRRTAAYSSKKTASQHYLTPAKSSKKPAFEDYTFQPSISKRSKKLAENRVKLRLNF